MKLLIIFLFLSISSFANCEYENKNLSIKKITKKCQPIEDGPVVDCSIFEATLKNKKNAVITGDIFFRSDFSLKDYCFNLKDSKFSSDRVRSVFNHSKTEVLLVCGKETEFLIVSQNKIVKSCK